MLVISLEYLANAAQKIYRVGCVRTILPDHFLHKRASDFPKRPDVVSDMDHMLVE
jgi:hypothetical protein